MSMSPEERFDLIRENLGEVLNPELIESILKEGRNPRIYWGKRNPSKFGGLGGPIYSFGLLPRYRYNWQTSLWIFRRCFENCPASRGRM